MNWLWPCVPAKTPATGPAPIFSTYYLTLLYTLQNSCFFPSTISATIFLFFFLTIILTEMEENPAPVLESRPRRASRSHASTADNLAKASALAQLKRLKETGAKRTDSYEVTTLEDIYDQVDESTYAAIAARKRQEAREFLVPEPKGKRNRKCMRDKDDDDDDDDDNGGEGNEGLDEGKGDQDDWDELEDEFLLDDEQSLMYANEEEKFKAASARRRAAAHRKKKNLGDGAPKRINAAFLRTDKAGVPIANNKAPSFVDTQLTHELDSFAEFEKSRRKAKKTKNHSLVDDMLFSGASLRALESQAASQAEDIDHDINAFQDGLQHDSSRYDKIIPQKLKNPTQPQQQQPDSGPYSPPPLPTENDEVASADKEIVSAKAKAMLPPLSRIINPIAPLSNKNTLTIPGDGTGPLPPPPQNSALGSLHAQEVSQITKMANTAAVPNYIPEWEELTRDKDNNLLFYWLDAHDVRTDSAEYLFLFGKAHYTQNDNRNIQGFVNLCIQIGGMERKLFFLPRKFKVDRNGKETEQQVDILQDLMPEVSDLLSKECKVTNFKAKVVSLSCPFGDPDASAQPTEYLKVKYPFNFASLSPERKGSCFQRIFGAKASPSEHFILKRKLMGPGWLKIANGTLLQDKIATVPYAAAVTNPKDITIVNSVNLPVPTLNVMSLSVRTILNNATNVHEIAIISAVFMRDIPIDNPYDVADITSPKNSAFTIVRQVDRQSMPFNFQKECQKPEVNFHCGSVEIVPNEHALLNLFLAKMIRYDPDVILSHDFLGFGLDVLIHRFQTCKTRDWSRLGRLIQRRDIASITGSFKNKFNKASMFFSDILCSGRLVCDTMIASKDLLPREKDYSLEALSHNVLGQKRNATIQVQDVINMYQSTNTLLHLIVENALDAKSAAAIAATLSVLPLSKQLTSLSGNVWSKTLKGARAERIEYLLCHELKMYRPKLLLPDKLSKAQRLKVFGKKRVEGGEGFADNAIEQQDDQTENKSSRRKPQYAGGLVLEPKKGLYDRFVLQLDFNSLYPSIIQEYNICFTTMSLADTSIENLESTINNHESTQEGVLPKVLRRLVEQRKQVKAVLRTEKDVVKSNQLEIRQKAIKLTANSIYGCLGFENSRFYARPLAELVTLKGRDTLQKTIDLAQGKFGAEVIYGDTDSIFVHTGLDNLNEVRKIGAEIKREVNKKYRNLEIEIDAVYCRMLLLKKKKYAALKLEDLNNPNSKKREIKGLDIVRHDWSDLSHDVSEYAIDQLLNADITGETAIANVLDYLKVIGEKVRNNELVLAKYIITRGLTKSPEEYPDAKNLPHVQVALRLRTHGRYVKAGEYIKYVICKKTDEEEGKSSGLSDKAYHPEEVHRSNGTLSIDAEWYLANQILPPLSRLFEPIEGVDQSQLADALGLDGSRYVARVGGGGSTENAELIESEIIETEADIYKNCMHWEVKCYKCNENQKFAGPTVEENQLKNGLTCPKCSTRYNTAMLQNRMMSAFRHWNKLYYCTPLLMEDDERGGWIPSRQINLNYSVERYKREPYDERWLFNQLRFMRYLVNPDRLVEVSKSTNETKSVLSRDDYAVYKVLFDLANDFLGRSAFNFIDLSMFLSTIGITCA